MIFPPWMRFVLLLLWAAAGPRPAAAQEPEVARKLIAKPGLFLPLREPPCSYCSTEHRKGLVRDDDLVLAWIRGCTTGEPFRFATSWQVRE